MRYSALVCKRKATVRTMRVQAISVLMSAFATGLIAVSHAQPSLTWVGVLPNMAQTDAYGVSNSGVVVGSARDTAGGLRAFRWESGTIYDLGTLGGTQAEARAISANGRVIVGEARDTSNWMYPFRWTQDDGMQSLGALGSFGGTALGISADGSVVVGIGYDSYGYLRACRWASNGVEDLNTTYASLLAGGSVLDAAFAISSDGAISPGGGSTERRDAWRASC